MGEEEKKKNRKNKNKINSVSDFVSLTLTLDIGLESVNNEILRIRAGNVTFLA